MFPAWYCCFNPVEREAFTDTAKLLPVTLFVGIPVDIWNSFWPVDAPSVMPRMSAFMEALALMVVNVQTDPEGPPIYVVAPSNLAFWVSAALWFESGVEPCPTGCPYFVAP